MLSLRSLFLFFIVAVVSVAAGTNQEGLAFLAKKENEEGVVKLASGLLYKELVAGTGKTPTANSPCSCHYAGTLIDGTEFDSSYKRGAVSFSSSANQYDTLVANNLHQVLTTFDIFFFVLSQRHLHQTK